MFPGSLSVCRAAVWAAPWTDHGAAAVPFLGTLPEFAAEDHASGGLWFIFPLD